MASCHATVANQWRIVDFRVLHDRCTSLESLPITIATTRTAAADAAEHENG